jgi:hypothetical protein
MPPINHNVEKSSKGTGMRFWLAILLILLSGCVSREYHQAVIPDPERGISNYHIEVGDRIRIETKSGDEFEFEVTDLTKTTVRGEGRELAFSDIHNLQVERVDTLESAKNSVDTVLIIAGSIAGIALIAL